MSTNGLRATLCSDDPPTLRSAGTGLDKVLKINCGTLAENVALVITAVLQLILC